MHSSHFTSEYIPDGSKISAHTYKHMQMQHTEKKQSKSRRKFNKIYVIILESEKPIRYDLIPRKHLAETDKFFN